MGVLLLCALDPPRAASPAMSTSTAAPLPLRTRAALFTQLAALDNAGLPAARAFAMLELECEAQSRIAQTQQLLARRGDIAADGEISRLFTELDARLLRSVPNPGR